jgi:hypothetical protein
MTTTEAADTVSVSTTSIVLAELGTRRLGKETLHRLALVYDVSQTEIEQAQEVSLRKNN